MFSVKELKILNRIANDARVSRVQLAKGVGMSRELVEYHLKKLRDRGMILGSQARVNLNAFSSGRYNLLLKVGTFSRESKLVETLKGLRYTHFVARIAGGFDYIVGFSIKKQGDLQNYIDVIYNEFSDEILGHEVLTVTDEIKNDFSGLFGKQSVGPKTSMIDVEEGVRLTNEDKIILRELSKDAEISAVELAGRCEMSAAGVLHRIKKLSRDNILLGFISEFDIMRLEKEFYYVYFSLKNPNKKNVGRLKSAILRNEDIVFGNQGVGRDSFLCLFFAESNRDLHERVLEFRKEISEVSSQSVYLILDFVYQSHLPEGFLD